MAGKSIFVADTPELSQLANCLEDAVVGAIQAFRRKFPSESPYGFAILPAQTGTHLWYAIATEERLRRVAARYYKLGYRYQGHSWQKVNHREEIASWIRWSNPDAGWHYGDFAPRYRVMKSLKEAMNSGVLGSEGEHLEEFCTIVLTSLQLNPKWRRIQSDYSIVVGVTAGEDPRDFLRTATRCNTYEIVTELWKDKFIADDTASRIERPL